MWNLKPLLLAGAIALPLHEQGNWQLLEYGKLPANEVSFGERGMRVSVNGSASPLLYPRQGVSRVARISVAGELDELLNVRAGSQGGEGEDDFCLKVGLVLAGDRRLGFFERLVSADWVKTLHDLAPAGAGIDRILFLNAVQHASQLGQRRRHPLSELIYERNVWLIDRSGPFELHYELETPRDVVAVWVSIDGDDSRSSYSTLIRELTLQGPPSGSADEAAGVRP